MTVGDVKYSQSFDVGTDSWAPIGAEAAGHTAVRITSAPTPQAGAGALKLNRLTTSSLVGRLGRTITGLTIGTRYSFRGWVSQNNSTATSAFTVGVTGIGTSSNMAVTVSTWGAFTYDFVATATSHEINFGATISGAVTRFVTLDSVEVVESYPVPGPDGITITVGTPVFNSSAAATSQVVAVPGTTAGDISFIAMMAISGVTIPSGWTALSTPAGWFQVFYRAWQSGDPSTVTVTLAGRVACVPFLVRGADTAAPIESSNFTTTTSTPLPAPTLTATAARTLVTVHETAPIIATASLAVPYGMSLVGQVASTSGTAPNSAVLVSMKGLAGSGATGVQNATLNTTTTPPDSLGFSFLLKSGGAPPITATASLAVTTTATAAATVTPGSGGTTWTTTASLAITTNRTAIAFRYAENAEATLAVTSTLAAAATRTTSSATNALSVTTSRTAAATRTTTATTSLAITTTRTATAVRSAAPATGNLVITTTVQAAASSDKRVGTSTLAVTTSRTAAATRTASSTTVALAVTTNRVASATRATSTTTGALAVTSGLTAAAIKTSAGSVAGVLAITTSRAASASRATFVTAALSVTTSRTASATRTTLTAASLSVTTTRTAVATKSSAGTVSGGLSITTSGTASATRITTATATLSITTSRAATATVTTSVGLRFVIVDEVKHPVASQHVIVGGIKHPVASMDVVVGGVKHPVS